MGGYRAESQVTSRGEKSIAWRDWICSFSRAARLTWCHVLLKGGNLFNTTKGNIRREAIIEIPTPKSTIVAERALAISNSDKAAPSATRIHLVSKMENGHNHIGPTRKRKKIEWKKLTQKCVEASWAIEVACIKVNASAFSDTHSRL